MVLEDGVYDLDCVCLFDVLSMRFWWMVDDFVCRLGLVMDWVLFLFGLFGFE